MFYYKYAQRNGTERLTHHMHFISVTGNTGYSLCSEKNTQEWVFFSEHSVVLQPTCIPVSLLD